MQVDWLRVTARQVSQVCATLEQAGDTPRLARFLWSLPTDVRSTAAFNQFEPVLKARAVVAFHSRHFHHLHRILTTCRSVAVCSCNYDGTVGMIFMQWRGTWHRGSWAAKFWAVGNYRKIFLSKKFLQKCIILGLKLFPNFSKNFVAKLARPNHSVGSPNLYRRLPGRL